MSDSELAAPPCYASPCEAAFCGHGRPLARAKVSGVKCCTGCYHSLDGIKRLGGNIDWLISHRMVVMPSNNSGIRIGRLWGRHGDRIAWLLGPGGWRCPPVGLPFALDNGAFGAWSKGQEWSAEGWLTLMTTVGKHGLTPEWALVPDVVASKSGTLAAWERWSPEVFRRGWRAAFAVQDGMTPEDVPPEADIIFVGGTTDWKWKTLPIWTKNFSRVHVGRVNSERLLWMAHDCRAVSCDGTGWGRGDKKQFRGLQRYLEQSSSGTRQQPLLQLHNAGISRLSGACPGCQSEDSK